MSLGAWSDPPTETILGQGSGAMTPNKGQDQDLKQRLQNVGSRLRDFLTVDLWSTEHGGLPTFRGAFFRLSRILYVSVRGFVQNRCLFHASALTYITVLSIVPVLAFVFSVAKGAGAYEQLIQRVDPALDRLFGAEGESQALSLDEPPRELDGASQTESAIDADALDAEAGSSTSELQGSTSIDQPQADADLALEGLGEARESGSATVGPSEQDAVGADEARAQLRQALDKVLQFVRDTDVSKLGAFGLIVLFYTVIKLLGSIERSFNEIWGVRNSRALTRKVSDYLAIVVITPLLILPAMGITAYVHTWVESDAAIARPLFDLALRVISLGTVWVAFGFIYLFLPNTRVRISSALLGGLAGGSLWQLSNLLMITIPSTVNPLYATFAAIPVFLVYTWTSWVCVLFGAEVASAAEKAPTYRGSAYIGPVPPAFREVIALRAMTSIGRSFLEGSDPWSVSSLSRCLGIPESWIADVFEDLTEAGFLSWVQDGEYESVLPAKALDSIRVCDVLHALRGDRMESNFLPRNAEEQRVAKLLEALDRTREDSAHNRTLRSLAEEAAKDSQSSELELGAESMPAKATS